MLPSKTAPSPANNGKHPEPAIWNLEPQPPQWAIDAGLPPPAVGEVFGDYCVRLGIPYLTLIDGLTERTAVNVHIRFSNMLADRCPAVWQEHLGEWIKAHRRP